MMYLISYDISLSSVRTRVAKELLKAGLERIQYSVFAGDLTDAERLRMESKIQKLTAKATDFSVLLLPLHHDMLSGLGEISSYPLDWAYLKGEKKILIL